MVEEIGLRVVMCSENQPLLSRARRNTRDDVFLPFRPEASEQWKAELHIEDDNHGNQKREHAGRQKALSPRKEKVKHTSYEHEEAEEAGFVGGSVVGETLRFNP